MLDRPEYYVQTGSMFENPYGVPHQEIVSMLVEMPAEVAAQVIFGKYVELSGLVFTAELIQNMIDRKYRRVTADRWFDKDHVKLAKDWREESLRNRAYTGMRENRFFTGIDFARQTDFTVIFTLYSPDAETPGASRLVYYRRLNRVPWESIYREVGRVMSIFGNNVLGDATGPAGDVIFESLGDRGYCMKHDLTFLTHLGCSHDGCSDKHYVRLDRVDPFQFTANSKKELIETLRDAMAFGYKPDGPPYGLIRVPPIVALEEELSFYMWDDKRLQTDCVMALGLAARLAFFDRVGSISVGSPWGIG